MYVKLSNIIQEEVIKVLNEIYKRPNNDILELGPKAVSKKKKYAKNIWKKIQDAYAYIGGCKSFNSWNGDDGFTDFLYGNYVWRIYFGETSEDIKAVEIYKPTDFGRKSICSFGENASSYNKFKEKDFVKSNHVYGEVSGKSEHLMQKDKRTNWIPKEEVPNMLDGKEIFLKQNTDIDKGERIPYDKERHYYRRIGDKLHRKSMYGHPSIKKS